MRGPTCGVWHACVLKSDSSIYADDGSGDERGPDQRPGKRHRRCDVFRGPHPADRVWLTIATRLSFLLALFLQLQHSRGDESGAPR